MKNKTINLGRKHNFAFTLSEVLITLGIIGVVAAISIPNLIENSQKDQTVTQLKKGYTTLSQAINMSISENGEVSNWDWGTDNSNATTIAIAQKYINPYLSIINDCGYKTTDSCARAPYTRMGQSSTYNYSYYLIFLKDGSSINFHISQAGTAYAGLYIAYDINGNKKPNVSGKDLFLLILYSTSAANKRQILDFYGAGYNKSREELKTNSTWGCQKSATISAAGDFCGALIQMDGWKISDDYPW